MFFINISSDEYHQYHQHMNVILRKLPSLIQSLMLAPPARPQNIYQKIHQFSQIQQALEQDLKHLVILTQGRYPASYRKISDRLVLLLENLLEYTDTLLHLAQEYPIDPTGAIQCWVGVVVDDSQFLREVSYLQMAIAYLPSPQPWGPSLHQAKNSIRNVVANFTLSTLTPNRVNLKCH